MFKFPSFGSPLSAHVKCNNYIVWNESSGICMMRQVKKSSAPLNTVNYILLDAVTGVFKWCQAEDSLVLRCALIL